MNMAARVFPIRCRRDLKNPMLKTMIIDDENHYREALQEILSQFPQVELTAACANAREALTLMEQAQPRLIFVDIHLPGLINGLEFTALVREKFPEISLVLLCEDKSFALEGYEAGAFYYLLKPFRPAQVEKALAKVQGVIRRNRAAAPTRQPK